MVTYVIILQFSKSINL